MTEYYFPNGCPICGADINFKEKTFTYQCELCGASANAHRQDTEYSKKFEPYHDLSSKAVNKLRRNLNQLYIEIWQKRMDHKRSDSDDPIHDTLINIGYQDNIRLMDNRYVKIITAYPEQGTCDVLILDNNIILEDVVYSSLEGVSNRNKANVWLATQLGLSTRNFKIGFLQEQYLKYSIEICNKFLQDTKKKAFDSLK